ncbi:hypothetical protein EH223_19225 [candidate division KSB1 bacterium]|nr:SoxR reducing system RseC family protein [candidate division KSB1 bacterium]RQW00327.1 MAG: hypothetical protein EH223_19225 [candidate division KSB1 bacterium]
MQETGTVISTVGDKAVIQLDRGAKCAGCNVCHTFGESKMRLEACNTIGASVGDWVNVSVEPAQVIRSSLILFIFPLFMMLFGYFFAVRFIPPFGEGIGILGAIAGLFLAFFAIKAFDKRQQQKEKNSAIITDFAQTHNDKKG